MSKPKYVDACRAFRWQDHLEALEWSPGGGVNLGRTILDRHAPSGRPAIHWHGKTGERRTCTFEDLSRLSSRFANWLRGEGVGQGDRVAGFLPRIPETIAVMVGTWKVGGVYVPIFTGFGPDAIGFRVGHSRAKVLCTHREYRERVPTPLPGGATIVTVADGGLAAGDVSFRSAVEGQPEACELVPCRRDDPAVLLYTSGSTGPPKGVKIATNFVAAIHPYMRYGVDLRPDDVFWPTGDPGWGYGLVCYMVALAMGVTVTSHEAPPAAEYCLERLRGDGVTNLATTPTLLRSIMALGPEGLRRHPVRIRCASSCGEPLNPEVVTFFRQHWGVTVMDHYGSSESGLPIGNFNALDMAVKPGSMGLPLPGSTMADDVIKSAGYRIGPFEVESAILHHPAVAEAAVVGKPDPLRGQIVKAFVVLKPAVAPSSGIETEIVEAVKARLGRHQYPREIEFVDQLPKTETGKIQRFLLRTR